MSRRMAPGTRTSTRPAPLRDSLGEAEGKLPRVNRPLRVVGVVAATVVLMTATVAATSVVLPHAGTAATISAAGVDPLVGVAGQDVNVRSRQGADAPYEREHSKADAAQDAKTGESD